VNIEGWQSRSQAGSGTRWRFGARHLRRQGVSQAAEEEPPGCARFCELTAIPSFDESSRLELAKASPETELFPGHAITWIF
jgi:hypothetical protein